MPTSLHLVVAFSDHGFGHIAQGAPVVNAFAQRLAAKRGAPVLRLTVLSRAPEAFLRARLQGAIQQASFQCIARWTGVDLVMADALRVNPAASLEAYRALHGPRPADWAARVSDEAAFLAHLPGGPPDLLLSDVPYLPLAAASELGVRGVALCSFDWELLFRHYCFGPNVPGSPADAGIALRIADEIRAAYQTVRLFLRPAPSVPGPDWPPHVGPDSLSPTAQKAPPAPRVAPIGPSGFAGRRRRAELDAHLPELAGARLLLINFGGIATPVDLSPWPPVPGWRFIVPSAEEASRHPDALSQARLLQHLPFEDLFASVDAILAKPGYGTFVEAAAGSVPVLYLPRGDWPEEPYLAAFLHAHTRALEIPASLLGPGAGLADALDLLLAKPPRPPAHLTGPAEAASLLAELLGL